MTTTNIVLQIPHSLLLLLAAVVWALVGIAATVMTNVRRGAKRPDVWFVVAYVGTVMAVLLTFAAGVA